MFGVYDVDFIISGIILSYLFFKGVVLIPRLFDKGISCVLFSMFFVFCEN